MANSNDSQPPITSGGYQILPREALQKKSFIVGNELDDSYINALYTANSTQYLKITKWALQQYLEACLKPDGQFRKFFDRFAPFTSDFVVNENFDGDRSKRHLQIARFFDKVVQRPPQFFISDSGYTYRPSGLGGFAGGWPTKDKYGTQVIHIFDSIPISVDITFASTSEDQVDEMTGFFSMAFGSFQRFLNNWYLQPDRAVRGAYWTVILPYEHQVATKSRQSIVGGDQDTFIWMTSFTLETTFENSTYVQYRADPRGDLAPGSLQLVMPQKVTLSDVVPLSMSHIPYPIDVYSDNYKVAVVQEEATQYIVYPRGLGTCNIIVRKRGGTEQEQEILAKKELKIVLR